MSKNTARKSYGARASMRESNGRFMFVSPAWRTQKPHWHTSRCVRRISRCCAAASPVFVLSHFEAQDLLSLRRRATELLTRHDGPFAVDLGQSSVQTVTIDNEGVSHAPHAHPLLTWARLQKLCKRKSSGAYEVFPDGSVQKIVDMSEVTNRVGSLMPVAPSAPPTLVLAGFSMHRVKSVDPGTDTANKIAAVGRLRGRVLDVCTGLGYTAIAAARCEQVSEVCTIELDPMVIAVARRNPWSQQLFGMANIRCICANATQVVQTFDDKLFEVIVHDPPARVLGGDLYSLRFYQQLHRVCARNGVLFHYIGDPNSRESGRLYRGIADRLEQAGFSNIQLRPRAYGLVAKRE
ncbi:unnamed protein product [Agarophyton chilense]